jgi:hypothetical protein
VVLDGWGLREATWDNAVTRANAPTWRHLWEEGRYPRATLVTHGPAVGLPAGQMGNSEVGHLNLGAGRVVRQSLQRIAHAIESGEFARNDVFLKLVRAVKARGATLHLMGLVGPGGVHAVDEHLLALCDLAQREEAPAVRMHLFLDGRDTPPQSARDFLTELFGRAGLGEKCRVATLMGRYWAMDRDRRWERTEAAYRAIVHGEGVAVHDDSRHAGFGGGADHRVQVPLVAVDAARRKEPDEVERAIPLPRVREGSLEDGVLRERSVLHGAVDAREVLVDDPPGAQVQVPHLGVPHLSLREADGFAAGGERGAGVFGEEAVHDRGARLAHGIALGPGVQPPAVEHDQSGERPLRRHGR